MIFSLKHFMSTVVTILFFCTIGSLASCEGNPASRATDIAKIALKASVDNPESVKILCVCKPVPIYGKDYVTPIEKDSLSNHLFQISTNILEETDYFQDFPKIENNEVLRRALDAVTTLRALIAYNEIEHNQDKKGKRAKPFSGWKVKIDFKAKTLEGKQYRSQYWFILDKKAQCVIKSFEIPYL